MKIFLTGASGFIGRNLLAHLLKSGHDVRAWQGRKPEPAVIPAKPAPECLNRGAGIQSEHFHGDLSDPSVESKIKEAMYGCEAVVHMAAKTSEDPSSEKQSGSVNVLATEKIAGFAKAAGIKRFVFVSSQSAKISSPGRYGATKKRGEEIVSSSGIPAVILRPALVYGPGEAGIFKKFVGIVERLPLIPIPYSSVTFQPVYVGDVVASIAACLTQESPPSRFYDIAGPDAVSFPGLIRSVARAKGLSRVLIPVPMPLAILGARSLSLIMKKPPVTVDNLIGLSEKTEIDLRPMIEELKVRPTPLSEGLKLSLPLPLGELPAEGGG